MNEQELEKFVEDSYKTWCDNNDISKVEDIDEKHLLPRSRNIRS